MFCSHVRYVCIYVWYVCTKSFLKPQRIPRVCAHLANKADSDSDLQQNIFQKGVKNYGLLSQDYYLLSIPKVRTNMSKRAFSYAAPFDWNQLQDKL